MELNQSVFIGKVENTPQLGKTQNGQTVATFNLMVNKRRPDENGQWVDNFTTAPMILFDRQAETSAQHLVPGQEITVIAEYMNWGQGHGFRIISSSWGFKPKQDQGSNQSAPQNNMPF